MKSFVGYLAFVLMLFAGTVMGQDQKWPTSQNSLRLVDNGHWWNILSDDAKATFVDGYTMAMSRASFVTHSECMSNAKDAKPGPGFDATFNAAMNLCVLAEDFDFPLDVHKLTDGIDAFYRDSRNTRLPIGTAIEYVRDELKGKKSARELEDELNEWRDIIK